MTGDNSFIKDVLTAPVYEVAEHTPLQTARKLSERLGNEILLKREDLQPVFSFKIRGSFNKIQSLSPEDRARGVICASAGNHSQGVALSAEKLGIPAIAVMPVTTPPIKVQAVKRYGAKVVLYGDSFNEAQEHCMRLQEETGAVFVHPFNDPLVIAGQGTIGHELLMDSPRMDAVFVPVGGGGLIAGIAGFLKPLCPGVKIIGVQPSDANAMALSFEKKRLIELEDINIFADGVAVKKPGDLTFAMILKYVDEFITVSTDETCSAIKTAYEDTRSILEPAGALALAAVKKYVAREGVRGRRLIAVNSGANMNFNRLQFVTERTETGEYREALFAVTIPEHTGSLRLFCEKVIGDRRITEFNYRLFDKDRERREAEIFVGVALENAGDKDDFIRRPGEYDFQHLDLTDNELAKNHIRHMVGGKSAAANNEALYRFRFPERPRALTDFLNAMREDWNISLFHYRSHGGDFGRVLIGFEIPDGDKERFREFLRDLHYFYVEETHNEAYKLFL